MTVKSIVTNIVCVFIVAPVVAALIVWAAMVLRPDPPPQTMSPHATSSQTASIRPAPHTPVSGRTVYMANCARCHGASGDGKGTEQLDRPARSFLDGGFSFGNTTEAIRRVVQHGIAGTPMPGFAGVLGKAQTDAVVKYVKAMTPPTPEVGDEAEFVVTDRPQVVRGMLPARGPWDVLQPRGLLVGGTDGLTLSYDTDDVRFRVARQGPFARRTDWEGRGGTPLEPLGRIIHFAGPAAPFWKDASPIAAEFLGTTTRGDHASIRLAVGDAVIVEEARTSSHETLPGYVRILRVSGDATGVKMSIPSFEAPVALGERSGWHWWRGGNDVFGVQGAQPSGDQIALPQVGTVRLLVLPGIDAARAGAAGIPVGMPTS
ncbi:MAG: cytochrome c [Phycisphaerales bacterium]|nr:cytochrome c [Phycisphaerales bacterium]